MDFGRFFQGSPNHPIKPPSTPTTQYYVHDLPSDSQLRHTPLLTLNKPLLVSIDHVLLSALDYDEVRNLAYLTPHPSLILT